MRIILFSILIFTTVISCGQTTINTKRVKIAGTNISIISPRGIESDKHFSRILLDDTYEMSIIYFNEANLESKLQEIDSVSYSKRGVKVIKQFEIKFNGYTGKVIVARSNPEADVVQLIFGDKKFISFFSTLFTKDDENLLNEIIESYKTIEINHKQKVDWDSFLSFRYNKQNFKLAEDGCSVMKLHFTNDGQRQDSIFNNTSIMCYQMPYEFDNITIEQLVTNVVSPSVNNGARITKVISDQRTNHDGNEAYEFIADYVRDDKNYILYCYVIIKNNISLTFTGYITKPEDLEKVKHFIESVIMK